MSLFEFLKNYKKFANHIRYITSSILLKELKAVSDKEIKKILMLRIVEELVSSTEDLAMWLIVIYNRKLNNRLYRNVWDNLLVLEINQKEAKQIFQKLNKLKSPDGFLRTMDFPSIKKLAKKLSTSEEIVKSAVKVILDTITASYSTRNDKQSIVVRFHNKIKHGMMVYDDSSKNITWIRDFSVKESPNSHRIIRKDRGFNIPIDIDKAERIVGTIKSNSYGIEALINILLMDYEYKILTGRLRMRRVNKQKFLSEIEEALR